MDLQDQGVIDSGCSRHMTGNMSYLTDCEEIDGGYVAFKGNPKGGKITRKCTIKTATKEETSGILKSFITRIENLIDHKVKEIKCDNETKFKNREMNQFCEMKDAFNIACYVQNKVSLVKPHNKTPYELFHGKTPTLSFVRPFGCLVTILITIYHLGKFNGKADEGFFVGYSLNSKAFRVFNSKTKIVEHNLHIRFSESTPNVVGSGPDWLFNIDALTRIMNYEPIIAGTQSNGFAYTKASDNAGQARNETKPIKYYILLPLWTVDPPFSQDPKSSHDDGSKPLSTNEDNELPFDPNMPALEYVIIFNFLNDDEDNCTVVDVNNLDTTIQVSHIPATRIHKDHPLDQVIRDLQSATQTRKMSKNLEEHEFMSSIGELTFFLGLQVKQKKYGIFISQDKYVVEILKKFGFKKVKTASTPMETQKPLLKDKDGKEVDVHMYRSMIGLLMYLTSSRPSQSKGFSSAACAFARYQVNPSQSKDGKEIVITESSVRRDLQLADEEGIDCFPNSTIFKQLALMRVFDLKKTKTTQRNEIDSLKRRVKKLEKRNRSRDHKLKRLYKFGLSARVESSRDKEIFGEDASKQGRIDAIDAEDEIILVNDADNEMFNVDDLEITLAQALEALKTSKLNVKGIVFHEPDKSTTTTTTIISSQQSQDKGKGIMIEELMKPKKKDQTRLDEEAALKLQAKIDADHRLAERLQAQEQEELCDAEKATLFQQLLEKRRKHFTVKREEEKRNKPPTKAQKRKIMCTYLKNMEGYKLKDLKLKEFDGIQKIFDRAFRRVNTFEDFRPELVEGKEKRVGEELEQEITKKQKVEDDKEKDTSYWCDLNGKQTDFSVKCAWESLRTCGNDVVWLYIRHLANMEAVNPKIQDIVMHILPIAKTRTSNSVVGILLLAASSYYIWIERNNLLFKNVKISPEELRDIIIVTVRLKLMTFRFKNTANVTLGAWSSRQKCHLRVVLFFPSPRFFPMGFSWEGFLRRQSHLKSYPYYVWFINNAARKLFRSNWDVAKVLVGFLSKGMSLLSLVVVSCLCLSDKIEAGSTTTLTAKLPILNPGGYNLWLIRIDQYFLMTDYSLWEVIKNGNKLIKRTVGTVKQIYEPTFAIEKLDMKNEMKARETLLMALPNKDQLNFHSYKDAKLLMEAIEKRCEGNKESKKTHALIWRKKADIETISLDDLYNNLKIYEPKLTGSSSTIQNPQNVAFVSSNSTSSTNEADNTTFGVSIAHSQGRNLDINGQKIGFDMSKVECFNYHKNRHFARECRSLKNKENRGREYGRKSVLEENPTEKALIAQDGIEGYDWSYQAKEGHPTNYALMALTSPKSSSSLDSEVDSCSRTCIKSYATLKEQYDSLSSDYKKSQNNLVSYKAGLQSVEEKLAHYKKNEVVFEEKINILNLEVKLRDNALVENIKKLEKVEKERDELKLTLEKFQNSSKSLNNFLENQENVKTRLDKGYHAVSTPYTRNYIPLKPDIMFIDEQVKSKSVDVVSNVASSDVKAVESKHEPISNTFKRGHSQVIRPYNKYSAYKKTIFNKMVNTFRVKDTSARERAIHAFREKQHQPEDIHELLRKLLEDLQIISEELAEYVNSSSWNYPTFYDDDDEYTIQYREYLENSSNAITPDLLTEEPDNSLSMGDEHLSTILKTESNEVINFSVENLVLIPSKSKGTFDDTCDVPFCDNSPPIDVLNDHFEIFFVTNDDCTSSDEDSFEDINYVEASPPDYELISLEESPSPFPILVENSDSFFEKSDTSLSYSDNSLLEFETFSDHTGETSSGSTTTHVDNSLPEYDSLLSEIEPDQGELTSVVIEYILGEPHVHAPNVLPTHPTHMLDSDFIPSVDSLGSDLEVSFPSETRNKIFDLGIFFEV
nr:hypothetical protein [Tanacetum cinerariifolium]